VIHSIVLFAHIIIAFNGNQEEKQVTKPKRIAPLLTIPDCAN